MAAGGGTGNSGCGNLAPRFRFNKTWGRQNQNSQKYFFECPEKIRFPILLDLKLQFSNYGRLAAGDGWELWERRVRKTLLGVGFPGLRTSRCPHRRISSSQQPGSGHASDRALRRLDRDLDQLLEDQRIL